jgi:hypothetical protein
MLEKNRLKELKNKVLRRIFRCKTAEVSGGQRKLYNEEHHNLYPESGYCS